MPRATARTVADRGINAVVVEDHVRVERAIPLPFAFALQLGKGARYNATANRWRPAVLGINRRVSRQPRSSRLRGVGTRLDDPGPREIIPDPWGLAGSRHVRPPS